MAQGLIREAALWFILKRSKIVFLGHAAPVKSRPARDQGCTGKRQGYGRHGLASYSLSLAPK